MNRQLPLIKSIIIILLILSSINVIQAIQLSLYPKNLKLTSSPSETVCGNIFLQQTNLKSDLILQDRWTTKGNNSKQLKNYVLKAENLEINITYPKIIIPEQSKIEICLKAKKPGKYSGALLFQIENSSLGIGNWIELTVLGNDKQTPIEENTLISTITGRAIDQNNTKMKYLLLEPLFLLIILLIAILLNQK
jgi:hypothetical protein